MHVLVTGGAGFIGSHSVEALLQAGARVRVLDNFSTGNRQNLPSHSELEIFEGDIRDPDIVAEAMDEMTHVLHLAAQVSVQASIADPATSCSINIQGFVNVLHQAQQHAVQRMVYASSAAVYGYPKELPVSEQAIVHPISSYGLEKSVNDQYAKMLHDLSGFSTLGLRYFNVYGPRQDPHSPYAGVISKFVSCIQQRQPLTVFGDGKQTRDFVFVKDVAQANVQALTVGTTGVCNIGTGRSWSLLEMIEVLSGLVGEELEVVHRDVQQGDIPHSTANVTRCDQELNVRYSTELREGLQELTHEVLTHVG